MEKNLLEEYLDAHFEQVLPKEFYRDIFPAGELETKGEQVHGKYNAIALCINSKEKFYNEQKKTEEFTGILKAWDEKTVTLAFEGEEELVFERQDIALIRLAFDF